MIAFSGNPLDRAADKRGDAAWLAAKRGNPQARVLPMWRLQPLLAGPDEDLAKAELCFMDGARAFGLGGDTATEVFLGLDGATAYFARDVSGLPDPAVVAGLGHFRDARNATAILPLSQVALVGQAKALIDWHAKTPFCARCAAATMLADAGYKRICTACKAEHFPRTDPAVIMLVTAGDHCLLARNKRFVGGHYSTLAGFVEPGESIEEAVRREVFEESGVKVGHVRYFASQPWPFPFSIMIGCFAESVTREIAVDGDEIIAARWFDRATVKRLISGESTEIGLPRRDAIAFHLVKTWAEEG
jgi:NAD+ diphosphatase